MGHGDSAVGTILDVAAFRALNGRGVAAAVEQQNHLSTGLQRIQHRAVQLATDRAACFATGEFSPQVNGRHVGQRSVENAFGQADDAGVLLMAVPPAFQGRGRRAENQRHLLVFTPPTGNIPGVVSRRSILFEGTVVFLIQHNQSQMRHRGKDGASRPDHHLHLAGGDLPPVPRPLGGRQITVQHRSVLDHLLNRLNIDFRFAAAGNAMQQNRLVFAALQRTAYHLQCRLLVRIQHKILASLGGLQRVAALFDADRCLPHQFLLAQRRDGCLCAASGPRQFGGRQ